MKKGLFGKAVTVVAGMTSLGGQALAQASIGARDLVRPHARQVELSGACVTDDSGGVSLKRFKGDKAASRRLTDIAIPQATKDMAMEIAARNGVEVSDSDALMQDVMPYMLCDADKIGPAVTLYSKTDQNLSYVFFNKDAKTFADIRDYFGWTQDEISDAEYKMIEHLHEQGHGLLNKPVLNALRGVDRLSSVSSAAEETLSDAYAICSGIAHRQLRPSAIGAWLELRSTTAPEDQQHQTGQFMTEAFMADLQSICSPQSRPGKPLRSAQLYELSAGVFLRHAGTKLGEPK